MVDVFKYFNEVSFFPEQEWGDSSSVLEIITDSAGANYLGCGGLFSGALGFSTIPMHWNAQEIMKNITFLELIPIMIAIEVWGTKLYKKKVLSFTGQCY